MFSGDARFLVADDTLSARDGIREILKKIGFLNVDEAENGQGCVEMLKAAAEQKRPYALVFLDLNMPEVDGLKALEMIRKEPKIADTPIIVVTTESAKQTVIRAVMQGVSGYVVKPFSIDDIKKKVVEVFQRVQAESSAN